MANAKQHFIVGAMITGAACLLLDATSEDEFSETGKRSFWEKLDFGRVLGFSLIGGAIALLADIFEPATSPNHRKFFHSFAFIGVLFWLAFGSHTTKCSKEERCDWFLCVLAYLSHLVLDLMTKRGLPFI